MPGQGLQSISATVMVIVGMVLLPLVGWLDYLTGIYISFSIFYLPPIALVAWTGGKWLGILAAVEGALIWLAADYFGRVPLPLFLHAWNALARLAIFLIIALFVRSVRLQLKGLQESLNRKTKEEETFHRLIPLCTNCNKIQDELGTWWRLEAYIKERTNMEFSHSACPECAGQQ